MKTILCGRCGEVMRDVRTPAGKATLCPVCHDGKMADKPAGKCVICGEASGDVSHCYECMPAVFGSVLGPSVRAEVRAMASIRRAAKREHALSLERQGFKLDNLAANHGTDDYFAPQAEQGRLF